MIEHDLIVIGAGPAGMAAARTAADGGASVRDAGRAAGPGRPDLSRRPRRRQPAKRHTRSGPPRPDGRWPRRWRTVELRHEQGAVVWRVEREGRVAWTNDGVARVATARRVLVATGAVERPIPIPGLDACRG